MKGRRPRAEDALRAEDARVTREWDDHIARGDTAAQAETLAGKQSARLLAIFSRFNVAWADSVRVAS